MVNRSKRHGMEAATLDGYGRGRGGASERGWRNRKPGSWAEVALDAGELTKLDGQQLVAGMPAEIFVQTGTRTFFEYLVKPITDYFGRALREE